VASLKLDREPPLHLQHCRDIINPQLFTREQRTRYLKKIPEWRYCDELHKITRDFNFKNYYQTVAFINATVWISHQQNHHPDIEFGYNRCTIHFTTHSADGITLCDFICAARFDVISAEQLDVV
jgi:4a-hydroxytetrahydrobiopterin dehydratase